MPMAAPITINMTTLAVATAVNAFGPSTWPTQIAPQVPASECSRLVISSGSAKTASVGVIGPAMKRLYAA